MLVLDIILIGTIAGTVSALFQFITNLIAAKIASNRLSKSLSELRTAYDTYSRLNSTTDFSSRKH